MKEALEVCLHWDSDVSISFCQRTDFSPIESGEEDTDNV